MGPCSAGGPRLSGLNPHARPPNRRVGDRSHARGHRALGNCHECESSGRCHFTHTLDALGGQRTGDPPGWPRSAPAITAPPTTPAVFACGTGVQTGPTWRCAYPLTRLLATDTGGRSTPIESLPAFRHFSGGAVSSGEGRTRRKATGRSVRCHSPDGFGDFYSSSRMGINGAADLHYHRVPAAAVSGGRNFRRTPSLGPSYS